MAGRWIGIVASLFGQLQHAVPFVNDTLAGHQQKSRQGQHHHHHHHHHQHHP